MTSLAEYLIAPEDRTSAGHDPSLAGRRATDRVPAVSLMGLGVADIDQLVTPGVQS
jgi:hypothetical protein